MDTWIEPYIHPLPLCFVCCLSISLFHSFIIYWPSHFMSSTTLTTGKPSPTPISHPLDQLSVSEVSAAREAILSVRGTSVAINFRSIFLEEPSKKELSQFLDLEHSGPLDQKIRRPQRLAKVQYDVLRRSKQHEYMESLVDVVAGKEVDQRIVEKVHQSGLTTYVFKHVQFHSIASAWHRQIALCEVVEGQNFDAMAGTNSESLTKRVLSHLFSRKQSPSLIYRKVLLCQLTQ
jgi:Cu2+-containing amine oxidase